ncbi:MAG: OmpA family protein [Myxococcota bacterium]
MSLFALCLSASGVKADDYWVEPFSLRLEGGLGGMLREFQQDTLDQGFGLMGSVRLGVQPVRPLVLQVGYETWFFRSDQGNAQQHTIGGGIRIEPRLVGDLYLNADVNGGVALTGDLVRFAVSAMVGAEWRVIDILGIGIFARYNHTFATEDDVQSDASMLAGGISITLRGRPAPADAGARDRDDDGVLDRDDLCPDEPAGPDPDPVRPGCPASDSDSDGVFDHLDECPSTPAGDHPNPNRPGCPDADRDADGVVDSDDACPDTHATLNPDPDRPGCPLPDRDGDSVADQDDACPDEFGAPHPDPARNGCPGLVRIEAGMIRILQPVFFADDEDTILEESEPVLAAVADALIATPTITLLAVDGHTDSRGETDYNQDLSERRARSVAQFLQSRGVEAHRLDVNGYGESRPLEAGENESAYAVNRRVEFRILEPAFEVD